MTRKRAPDLTPRVTTTRRVDLQLDGEGIAEALRQWATTLPDFAHAGSIHVNVVDDAVEGATATIWAEYDVEAGEPA